MRAPLDALRASSIGSAYGPVGGPSGALQQILPSGAVAAQILPGEDYDKAAGDLFGAELAAIEGASPSRRREFAEGRACARRALGLLGLGPVAIAMSADGAPRWPRGVVGSITHKDGYRAAAVAPAVKLAGLGIDAELDEPLPSGVLESIALAVELDEVERLARDSDSHAWDRLLFSAKEACVKAAHPLGLGRPELRSTEIHLDGPHGAFRAELALRGEQTSGGAPRVNGRWLACERLLIAVAAVRRDGTDAYALETR